LDVNFAHLVVWYLVFVFSTTCHEFAHAFAAYRGGDPTAYEGGQMSLDPVPHIQRSPFGMVLVPLLSFVHSAMQTGSGWMIGWASAPYDAEWGKRHPRRQALMSLAGPTANLILALVALGALRALLAFDVFVAPERVSFSEMVGLPGEGSTRSPLGALAMALSIMLNLNVLLCLFNLLPIPPLDGAGVVEGFAPRRTGPLYERMREIPMMAILGLVIAWQLFSYVAGPAFQITLRLVHPSIVYR
jgi:Zn-dependent protease